MTTPTADETALAALRERYARAARNAASGGCGRCPPDPADGVGGCVPCLPDPADDVGGCGRCPPDPADRVGGTGYAAGELADLPLGATAASLGCGNPVAIADLREGETVLDLGSGGGLDVLLSARRVGPRGRAIGLDMTPQMLDLARANAARAGAGNVEFLLGRIEDIPLPDASVDVVISNCVLTLSLDKPAVFAEIARVLRPGGRVGISDLIADPSVSEDRRAACPQAAGAAASLTGPEYRAMLAAAGLTGVEVTVTHPAGPDLSAAIIRATRVADAPPYTIAAMTAAHAPQVLAIYQAGIDTGDATFEATAPDWAAWDAAHLPDHRHVALDRTGAVLGWVALAPVSDRCVYGGVAENSVYVHPDARGHGVGRRLLEAVIASSEAAGIWTLQTGIFPENTASLALHRATGFRDVGIRTRIGRHHGRWRDVVFLERRSTRVGTD